MKETLPFLRHGLPFERCLKGVGKVPPPPMQPNIPVRTWGLKTQISKVAWHITNQV